jgi:hypothetical protein
MLSFSKAAKVGFAKPDVWHVEIPFGDAPAPHTTLMQNFVDAILDGSPLIAPGEQGLGSVELANAIVYSSIIAEDVRLPLDACAYEIKLQELIANSKFEKKVVEIKNEDFARSFHR